MGGWWVWDVPHVELDPYLVCYFRRTFDAGEVGPAPVLHVSADCRYRAYLNGELVSRGPCRSVIDHYRYETVDLRGRLRAGANVLAVEVRWYGRHAPVAEVHLEPGLWAMVGTEATGQLLVTDEAWRVWRSTGHAKHPLDTRPLMNGQYTVVDPCEDVDARQVPAGWQLPGFDDGAWRPAVKRHVAAGRYARVRGTESRHELTPRPIPIMEESPIAPVAVHAWGTLTPARPPESERQILGTLEPQSAALPPCWGDDATAVRFDVAGTHYLILNMGKLVTGYPRVTVTAPAGTLVELRYSEALSREFKKGVRDDAAAGTVEGYCDLFTCRAGENAFEPVVWRTFRFLRVAVHHPGGPATIEHIETTFTAYPLKERGTFASSEPLHRALWDVSWWTARLCAHEHYEDCPYYEQVQYIGDTRLQALVSYVAAGDFRLARQALRTWADTRRADGITFSRMPTRPAEPQIIPNFSLIWIEFLEDFYRYSGDLAFVRGLRDVVASTLRWFEQFDDGTGSLAGVPYWVFTDWSIPNTEEHVAGSEGELNLRRVGGLRAAARLMGAIGDTEAAARYAADAERVAAACRRDWVDAGTGLFRDYRGAAPVSEHPSLLAVLYDVVTPDEGRRLLERLEAAAGLKRTTIYFSYYKFRAYEKLGLYGRAWAKNLHVWTDMLALHASTWFEAPEPTRSDCHAWGSWILCDLLTAVLGVTPAEPGFARVRVAPNLMGLGHARGTIPTVRGELAVEYRREGDAYAGTITLPTGVTGTFVAPGGGERPLGPGVNGVAFDAPRLG